MAPQRHFGSTRSHRSLGLLLVGASVLWSCGTGGFRAPAAPKPEEIPALERAAASAPRDVDALVRLGAAYRAAGRLDDAQRVLEDALRVDRSSDEAIFVLGLVYDEAGQDSSAVALYRRYLDEHPSGALSNELNQRLDLVRRRALQASVDAAIAGESALASTPPKPRTVGVFPFTYQGPDARLRPLGRALAEMLTTDLSQTDRLTVVERLRVQLLVDEMKLTDQQRVDPATAARSGHLLGVSRVVQGVLDGNEDQLLMEAVAVPVGGQSAEVGKPMSARDPARRFFDMEKQIVLSLYEAMGVELTVAEREAVLHRPTENLDALLAFGLGLEAQDAGRFQEAAARFSEAANLDPGFSAASQLAQQSQSLFVAEGMDLAALIQSGLSSPADVNSDYEQWLTRVTSFTDIEGLIPGILGRDPVPELLGKEGVGSPGATIEIIIRRPGGDR